MRFKNYEIESFMSILYSMNLKGKDSRMRTRLIRRFDDYLQQTLNTEKDELIHQYAQKDEMDQPILTEDKTQAILVPETASEFHAEFDTLMNETYIIEENESTLEILLSVGNSILNCDLEFSEQNAILYDQWCEKFEDLIERGEYKEES